VGEEGQAEKPEAPLKPESNPPVRENPALRQPLEKQGKPDKKSRQ